LAASLDNSGSSYSFSTGESDHNMWNLKSNETKYLFLIRGL